MTKELTPAELADVLASGKYKKACGALRTTSGHCCLGVWAEEAGILRGDLVYSRDNKGYVISDKGTFSDCDLGPSAPEWMQDYAPDDHFDSVEQRLITLNDENPKDKWDAVIDFLRRLGAS